MQELLLINPAKRARRKSRKAASPAQRRARAAFGAAARARAKNPTVRRRRSRAASTAMPARRRRLNPIRARARSRRRNPISAGGFVGTTMALVKDAAIGGAGAIAVDVIAGQVKSMLPTSLQSGNAYAAAKALITVGVGVFGRRVLGGIAMQAARGALTVQAYNLMKPYVPASLQLGYLSPAYVMPRAASGKPIAFTGSSMTRMNALSVGTSDIRPMSGVMGGLNGLRRVGGYGGYGDEMLRSR